MYTKKLMNFFNTKNKYFVLFFHLANNSNINGPRPKYQKAEREVIFTVTFSRRGGGGLRREERKTRK